MIGQSLKVTDMDIKSAYSVDAMDYNVLAELALNLMNFNRHR